MANVNTAFYKVYTGTAMAAAMATRAGAFILSLAYLTLAYLCLSVTAFATEPISEPISKTELSAADISALQSGQVVSRIWRDPTQHSSVIDAFAAVDIKASAEDIWAVMTDCEKSVQVVANMKSCTVLSGSVSQGSDIREQIFRTPFPFPKFRSVFKSDFILHQQISFQKAGGDMKVQNGLWRIIPIDGGVHRVTYQARVGLNAPIPRFMIKNAVRKDTPELMMNLRDIVLRARSESFDEARRPPDGVDLD